MAEGHEIERRFLPAVIPEGLERCRAWPIQQGYLSLAGGRTIRIRSKGDTCYLTIKEGDG